MELSKLKAVLEREANERKLFKEGAELVETLMGLEQHGKELAANVANLKKDIAKLEEQKAEHVDVISRSRAEADNIVEKAFKQADEARAKAAKDAADMLAKADAQKDMAKAAVDALFSEKLKLEAENAKAADELEKLMAALAKAKEQMKAFIG